MDVTCFKCGGKGCRFCKGEGWIEILGCGMVHPQMEGASVAVVCDALNVPFCVLRAISDAADMDAGFSFDEFLVSSAKESAAFIIAMLDELANA